MRKKLFNFAPNSIGMKTLDNIRDSFKLDKIFLVFLFSILSLVLSSTPSFAKDTSIKTETNCAQALKEANKFVADTACLPALRWTNPVIETSGDISATGVIRIVTSFVTRFFLGISQFIWNIILWISQLGDISNPNNIVAVALGGAVNGAIAYVGGFMIAFTALFWALALWRSGKDFFRGRIGQAVKNLLIFAIIYAFIFITSTASIAANEQSNKNSTNYPLTLPWMAAKVSDFGNKLTSPIIEALTTANKPKLSGADVAQSCTNYVNQLNKSYLNGTDSNGYMYAMSSMWYDTQYKFWQAAQFGNAPRGGVDIPNNTMCHWAEVNNTIPSIEQQVFAAQILPSGAINAKTTTILPPFQKEGNDADMKKRIAAGWAICYFNSENNKWETRPEWLGLGDKATSDTNFFKDSCSKVFTGSVTDMIIDKGKGGTVKVAVWKVGLHIGRNDPFYIFNNDNYAEAFGHSGDSALSAQTESARAFTEALIGDNFSDKFPNGILALLIALIFLIVFVPLLLGAVFANLMLYMLLIALPIVLALYASGFKKSSSALKLTGTTMVTSIFFTLLISSIIFISGILRYALSNIPLGGFLHSLVSGICPLIAFLIVRKILKSFGMADILKPTGALSFLGSAAMIATGDQKLKAMGKVDPRTGKNAIQRGMTSAASGAVNAGFKLAALTAGTKKGMKMAKFKGKAALQKKSYNKLSDKEKAKAKKDGKFKEHFANTKLKKSQVLLNKNSVADANLKRKKDGELSRVNKMFDWMDNRAINGSGDGKPRMFDSMLLYASTNKDKMFNTLDPKTQQALGYKVKDKPKPALSQWKDQIYDKSYQGDGIEFDAPVTASPALIKLTNENSNSRLSKDNAGKSIVEVNSNYDKATNKVLSNVVSQYHPDGFQPLTNQASIAAAMLGASDMLGVQPNQVVVSSEGVPMVRVMDMNRKDMKELPAHVMKLPYMYYSDDFRKQRDGEDADQWVARMHMAMRADNLMDDQGNMVDMLEMFKLSEDDVYSWQKGAKNPKLNNTVFSPKNNNFIKFNQAAKRAIEKRQIENSILLDDAIFNSFAELESTISDIPLNQSKIDLDTSNITKSLTEYANFMVEYNQAKINNALNDQLLSQRNLLRKELDNVKDSWLSNSSNHQSTVIASDVLADAILKQEKAANDIVDELVNQLSDFTELYEGIDNEITKIYAGNLDNLETVLNNIKSNADKQKNVTKVTKEKIDLALNKYKESGVQIDATTRRTSNNYQKTTKNLFDGILEGFPVE